MEHRPKDSSVIYSAWFLENVLYVWVFSKYGIGDIEQKKRWQKQSLYISRICFSKKQRQMPQPFEVHSKYVALNAFRVSAFISCFYLSENTF